MVLGQEQLPPFKAGPMFAVSLYNVLAVLVIYPFLRRFRFPEKEDPLILDRGEPMTAGPGTLYESADKRRAQDEARRDDILQA